MNDKSSDVVENSEDPFNVVGWHQGKEDVAQDIYRVQDPQCAML